MGEKRNEALQAKATEVAAQVGGDKTLQAVAAEASLAVTTPPAFSRSGSEAGVAPQLAAKLFAAKPGAVVTAPAENGVWIAQLKDIERPEAKAGEPPYELLSRQLQDSMRGDLVAEFDRALRTRYPVEIRRDELQRFF